LKKINYTEEALVNLLKEKDVPAFNALYDHYSGALYGVILRIIPTEKIAQDILQEVFVKIWKSSASYDSNKGRLYTWMLNIARNSAIDYSRSKQSKQDQQNQNLDNSVYEFNKQSSFSINTDTIGVKQEVQKLKDDYQILIDMIYYRGFTQEETAKALNIPLGTVKTRVRAAIVQLRDVLK
jgi:RNA polymerase sigma factor (sigma-70 family)